MRHFFRFIVAMAVFLGQSASGNADTVRVAVASNFQSTAELIAKEFEMASGHHVLLSNGSTGKLYAQILNGAPFDIFLAADQERPALLLNAQRAVKVQTYAVGRLVLVGPEGTLSVHETAETASQIRNQRIAIADPDLAPYGKAAIEVLENLGLEKDEMDLVFGENIAQTAGFFATGNVRYAMIARSQLHYGFGTPDFDTILLDGLHAPISQDAALLTSSSAANVFFDFLNSRASQGILYDAGYEVKN
ncbi:molybdate ABC transporter substrate-binding protein [Pseudohalocynthiibacter aestuariivivens]|jgi:molybdate transport system substrate-binding protein|uniref:Molybdate ABC transporter substrate-binding protein n=1 Tax=Pseudohalocynthiibacter aestuariivivens TaxID=1591409 RepID=A0ABV5JG88_9RHOB|nr:MULTISPECIES: molybdate ABC transporter substrate-binding protein [Pseudohalocynthiibacter]MBS9716205.1 molybdate ABC transporter substrate-binding protein [Pseudohalocynthiibacter aestuariivivens]MCK0100987.1 molybdate ABC transporter substrate-binding protein [Pseudohalocynthiibacter sp. F2068]